jgi:hypothetical protein
MIRVSTQRYGCDSWCGCEGLFFWTGYSLVYPFYDGKLNDVSSREFEIDQALDSCGFVPNLFQAISEFEPEDMFGLDNGITNNKILFSDLSEFADEIYDNCVSYNVSNNHYDSDNIISVGHFEKNYRRYFVIFLGRMNDMVYTYLRNNRPYDFDIDNVFSEFSMSIGLSDVIDTFDSSYSDCYFFIQPRFLDIKFDKYGTSILSRRIAQSQVAHRIAEKAEFYGGKSVKKTKKKEQQNQCQSYTARGDQCSRLAKKGEDYCGIHLKEMIENGATQCHSYTARGDQCCRLAKDGYDYCGIHLRNL